MSKWLLFLLVLVSVTACNKQVTENVIVPDDTDYFPLSKGAFRIYQIDSISYRDLEQDTITTAYRLKEVLSDTFTDNSGHLAFRIMRYKQYPDKSGNYENQPWQFFESTSLKGTNSEIQIVENNQPYLRLVFPLNINKQWNGNAYNTLGIQNYTVNYVDQELKVFNKSVPTAKVTEKISRTKLSLEEINRTYARGIGLIHGEYWDISTDQIDPLNEVEKHIKKGRVVKQDLIETGNE